MRWSWRVILSLCVGAAAIGHGPVEAAVQAPLGPGRVDGTINPYVVKRQDSARWIAVRFGVHPIRVSKRSGLVAGETLMVDQRRITPRFASHLDGIVLNIPEASVYLVAGGQMIKEYPVAVSTAESKMPLGRTRVVSMAKHPTWFVPLSIQAEMAAKGRTVLTSVPPGPANPLGPRWIGVWNDSFGLHGTNVPTSIKQYASHGCVRFLPEDIKDLYDRVGVGTPVWVLYQPLKLAVDRGGVWIAAYPDIYGTGYDYVGAVKHLATQAGVLKELDWAAVRQAIRLKNGILVKVTASAQPSAPPKPPTSKVVAPPTPSPEPSLPPEDDGLEGIPPEWLQERPPDPWFDQI